ncbi:MAG: ABC transporter substrate-binding protein, partial [Clostridia bacterium]|nr:ABC transporter substrate-binding protein [Clostridia bacterium]
MKKVVSILLAVAMLVLSALTLASCNTQTMTPAEKIAAGETLKVGVIQYMSHPSLDNCYEGIREALLASGIKMNVERQTGSAASADSDCSITAENMVAAGYDIIIAIATPAAAAAFAATETTDIPVI